MNTTLVSDVPLEVEAAKSYDWGVIIDAFLMHAAPVGSRYTGSVYCDRSGASLDGMTVVTPRVIQVAQKYGMTLVRSISGADHYVVVTPFSITAMEALDA
jgi:hypothetical protein